MISPPSADDSTMLAALAVNAHTLRRRVAEMVGRRGHGYLQQGLGAADLFATLFFAEMRLDPAQPDWPDRDRFFLSPAHNSALFHASLAERGFLEPERLATYCEDGSPLELNVSERLGPVVEGTFGSLGQALSVAAGVALAARRQQRPSRCYVILGDGELQEGQTWEAAWVAASNRLDTLCLIVDVNDMQVEGATTAVLPMPPLDAKWRGFGWHVVAIDGNDLTACLAALDEARATRGRPTVILAQTLPGKGVPAFEGLPAHTVRLAADAARQALVALAERAP